MMGVHVIKMPDIGEGIADVELVEWHVEPGDAVVEDQTLADVMTDKATVEIPSPVAGTVLALGGKLGEVMAVGSELIRIEVEGAGNVKGARPARRRTAALRRPHPPRNPGPRRRALPRAGYLASGASTRRQAPVTRIAPARDGTWRRAAARSAAARAGAYARGLDAYARAPRGRLELDRYAERHDQEAVPVIGLRRKIAQKMQEAKRRIPHFTYVERSTSPSWRRYVRG
jgi:2-oxoisovalerate dehydrogenase E2 component (dihydrolipoyl transacylase)